jgi:hypothetical protein
MQKFISIVYFLIIFAIFYILLNENSRKLFILYTNNYPYIMGIIKIGLLGTMGELLSTKIVYGKWKIKNNFILQRAFIWGIFGFVFTFIFPLFALGTEQLIEKNLLFGFSNNFSDKYLQAFYTSLFMNIFFGFEMMVFHRITDILIDENKLFKPWPLIRILKEFHWNSIIKVILPSIFWFWIPAHTITFSIRPEFRIIMAAFLSIILGLILGINKKKTVLKIKNSVEEKIHHK